MLQALQDSFNLNLDLWSALVVWALIFSRTIAMLIFVPFLGGRGVPSRVKLMLGLILATFVYWSMYGTTEPTLPEEKAWIIAYFFKEIFFGLSIGMVTILCFYAIEAGGRIVDSQRGSSNAQIFIPALGQVTIYGLFQYWLGVSFFIAIGGHVDFMQVFLESFNAVNVMELPTIAPGVSPFLKLFLRMSADVLVWGMQLAAPILIAIFLTDLVLGIANKMAPQIPVFELGFLMKGYVGSAMIAVSIAVLIDQMQGFTDIMNDNVLKIVKYFAI